MGFGQCLVVGCVDLGILFLYFCCWVIGFELGEFKNVKGYLCQCYGVLVEVWS